MTDEEEQALRAKVEAMRAALAGLIEVWTAGRPDRDAAIDAVSAAAERAVDPWWRAKPEREIAVINALSTLWPD